MNPHWDGPQKLYISDAPLRPFALRWTHKEQKLAVLRSIAEMNNGCRWVHVSVSGKVGWKELQMVKNVFIGMDKPAVQMFPRSSELVDVHDVYHLWSPLTPFSEMPNLHDIIDEVAE